MPPYVIVHNKRWKHSGEPSNGGDGACEDALSFAIERLAAPWPQRTRNKEHMPKGGRRIKEDISKEMKWYVLSSEM